MSRLLRYQVAVSLDGFIAGPQGEYDWIVMGGNGPMPGLDVVVFSKTLPPATDK